MEPILLGTRFNRELSLVSLFRGSLHYEPTAD